MVLAMTKPKLFRIDAKLVRNKIRLAKAMADDIHLTERELIRFLGEIDRNRYYVRLGYKSLRGFCEKWLRFSMTQSQRLVTEVRRQQFSAEAITRSDDLKDRVLEVCHESPRPRS